MDINQIANLITEDPDVFNKLLDKWDQKSELDHDAYFLVLRILNRVLARYELKLDQKKVKATPTPNGFTVKGLSFLDATKPEKSDEEMDSLAMMPAGAPPPGGDMMGGEMGGMPGAPPPPPGMPPMESTLREFNEKHKKELIDRLVKADNDPSAAHSFEAYRDVNIYRALSGEFAKELRKNGLAVTHHYMAPPPGTKQDPKPIFSISKLKEVPPEMLAPEPKEEPLGGDLGGGGLPPVEASPDVTETPGEAPATPGNELEAMGQALPPELAPDVSFPEMETEQPPMEDLQRKLNEILG